jgi:PPOX class probable F420-dependent enzyme
MSPDKINDTWVQFLTERHLATLTTLRADGSPHVVPVGFTYDLATKRVRIITFSPSQKVTNALRGGRAAVSQVDGGRWLTLEGTVSATNDPKVREDRWVIEIAVDRVLGRVAN